MKSIVFEIPGKPTGKMRPKASTFAGHARVYTPSKQIEYENWVRLCYQNAGGESFGDKIIGVRIYVYQAMPKSFSKKKRAELLGQFCAHKADLDNIAKSILDAGNGGIMFNDDNQVATLYCERRWADEDKVEIAIEELALIQ